MYLEFWQNLCTFCIQNSVAVVVLLMLYTKNLQKFVEMWYTSSIYFVYISCIHLVQFLSTKCVHNFPVGDMKRKEQNIFVILADFLLFYSIKNPNNLNIKKMKKPPGNMIILHKCTKNHDYMLYCSWDMTRDGCNFYFFSLEYFLFLYTLPCPKNQSLYKNEKSYRRYRFTHVYQKLWSDDVRFLRYGEGRTDRRTGRRKKWHIEVKIWLLPTYRFLLIHLENFFYFISTSIFFHVSVCLFVNIKQSWGILWIYLSLNFKNINENNL